MCDTRQMSAYSYTLVAFNLFYNSMTETRQTNTTQYINLYNIPARL